MDFATEARGAVDMFAAMVTGYAPKAEPLWTEGAKTRVSMALAPVMEKYGFSFGAMPCEVTLLIVAGPLLWQTSRIVAAQMQADRAQDVKAKPVKEAPADPLTRAAQPQAPDQPKAGDVHQAPMPEVHDQMKLYAKA